MATITMSPFHSRPQPNVSSPLASQGASLSATRPSSKRNPSFPPSRPLRPFASISNSFTTPNQNSQNSGKPSSHTKQVKLIQPPKNQKGTFVLNLTQAEFSRQD